LTFGQWLYNNSFGFEGVSQMLCNSLLTIDEKSVAADIERNIRTLVQANSARGVVMGLSGGIDSALIATLAVRALGKERVLAYHLYDRDSDKQSRQKAQLMADWLGIELKCCDIAPAMREKQIYAPLIMRLTMVSGFINRCFGNSLNRLFAGELPFISTLRRAGAGGGNSIVDALYDRTVGRVEAAFNARHRYRRSFLEQKAKEKNMIVLGAANRSECMVGWFVKDGIDDMPFSPINHLYKTQVRQLADYLLLPGPIRKQRPSPDMLKGLTDEDAVGIRYACLDVILEGIEHGLTDEQILALGPTAGQIAHVRKLKELSEWKRIPHPQQDMCQKPLNRF
jgi:NAD+ synthase